MQPHRIVSQDEWTAARKALLTKEKEHTRARDALNEARQAMPWVEVEKPYTFDTLEGRKTLADLFGGRSQLIVKHFMLAPGWSEGCVGCSFECDHIEGALPHLVQKDVAFVAISRASLAEIESYKQRMGWTFDWVSSHGSDFNYDFHVSFTPEQLAAKQAEYNYEVIDPGIDELSGISVFARDDKGGVYHTYGSFGRGAEEILGTYMLLDLTPKGRDEHGPNFNLTDWVKRHDDYAKPQAAGCCHGAS